MNSDIELKRAKVRKRLLSTQIFNFHNMKQEGKTKSKNLFKVQVDINMLTRTIHINFSISVHFHNVTFIRLAACVLPL